MNRTERQLRDTWRRVAALRAAYIAPAVAGGQRRNLIASITGDCLAHLAAQPDNDQDKLDAGLVIEATLQRLYGRHGILAELCRTVWYAAGTQLCPAHYGAPVISAHLLYSTQIAKVGKEARRIELAAQALVAIFCPIVAGCIDAGTMDYTRPDQEWDALSALTSTELLVMPCFRRETLCCQHTKTGN